MTHSNYVTDWTLLLNGTIELYDALEISTTMHNYVMGLKIR
jgi:hypothetical protein